MVTNYRGSILNRVSSLTVTCRSAHPDVLDPFYVEVRRCRQHRSGEPDAENRTHQEHECGRRCTCWHACKPLGASVVSRIVEESWSDSDRGALVWTALVFQPRQRVGGSRSPTAWS